MLPKFYMLINESTLTDKVFEEGSIYFCIDTKSLYIDPIGLTERTKIGGGDPIIVNTEDELQNMQNAISDKLYITLDTGCMYIYHNNTWVKMSGSGSNAGNGSDGDDNSGDNNEDNNSNSKDLIFINTETELENIQDAASDKLYIVLDTRSIYVYHNNTWVKISGSNESEILDVTIDINEMKSSHNLQEIKDSILSGKIVRTFVYDIQMICNNVNDLNAVFTDINIADGEANYTIIKIDANSDVTLETHNGIFVPSFTESDIDKTLYVGETGLVWKEATGDGGTAEDGYTPVRGVDYWTEEDIAEIKGYVDEAILGGEW